MGPLHGQVSATCDPIPSYAYQPVLTGNPFPTPARRAYSAGQVTVSPNRAAVSYSNGVGRNWFSFNRDMKSRIPSSRAGDEWPLTNSALLAKSRNG